MISNELVSEVNETTEHIFNLVTLDNLQELAKAIHDPNIEIWTLKKDNSTILHTAAFLNLTESMKTIITETKKRLDDQPQVFKAFINDKTEKGLTPLHYASFRGNMIIASLLIENGAIINEKCDIGMNVLHFAAQGDQPSSLIFFKEKYKLSIKSKDKKNNTPLHWAALNDKATSLMFLLQWETNINEINIDGQTALHLAVKLKRSRIVKKLLQNGADPMIKDNHGRTCIDYAKDNEELKDIFRKKTICETLFFRPTITKKKLPLVNVFLFIIIHIMIFILNLFIIFPVFDNIYIDIIYLLMFFLVFMLYFIMMKSDPGNLTTLFKRNLLAIVEKGENISDYCPHCYIHQKATTKHCLVCNKCIEFFDHHCFWLNNCIGVSNYFCFIAFLVLTILNNFFNVGLAIYAAALDIDITNDKWRLPFIIKDASFLYSIWTRRTIAIIVILVCIGFLYPVVSILISQRKTIDKMSLRQKQKIENKLAVPLLTFDEIGIDNNIFVSVNLNNNDDD